MWGCRAPVSSPPRAAWSGAGFPFSTVPGSRLRPTQGRPEWCRAPVPEVPLEGAGLPSTSAPLKHPPCYHRLPTPPRRSRSMAIEPTRHTPRRGPSALFRPHGALFLCLLCSVVACVEFAGAGCTSDSDCAVEEICSNDRCAGRSRCTSDAECPSSNTCRRGLCHLRCKDRAHCRPCERCTLGLCLSVRNECTTDSSERACTLPEACVGGTCGQVCAAPGCLADEHCPPGTHCTNLTCVPAAR